MTSLVLSPISDLLSSEWYHNTLQAWLIAATTGATIFLVLLLARRAVVSRLTVLALRTTTSLDDMFVGVLGETRKWVLFAISVYIATLPLTLARAEPYLHTAAKVVVLWQAALWGVAAVSYWVTHYMHNRATTSDRASIAMVNAVAMGAKVVLWILVVITALKTVFGIEVTALVTGLGIGGIAVALAVQNILGDLLAALAIVFDKPFDVGDSIAVDQLTGTVEHIGLKTTRIRSADGEQVIIGNSDLLKSRLRNFKRMEHRRAQFNVAVTYDTPVEVLARLPKIIEEIVTAQNPVRFDRCHVASLGDSAIRLETAYYVLDPAARRQLDIQHAINLELLRRFAAENVKFALPSVRVYREAGG